MSSWWTTAPTDGTAAIARAAGATVVAEPRRGYGQACWAGVVAAEAADVIVLLDGDAADEPSDLPRVLGPLLDGTADLVIGSRALGAREPGSMTPHQVFGNWLAATIMRTLVRHRRDRHGAVPGDPPRPTCWRSTCAR